MDIVLPRNVSLNVFQLVEYYFQIKPKLKYKNICTIINEFHGLPLTMRQLKEIYRRKGYSRRRNVDDVTLHGILSNELGRVFYVFNYIS